MNLNKIKKVYKSIGSPFTLPLRYIPFSLFCGKEYRNTYKELIRIDTLSEKEKEDIYNIKLINYLNESISHTKFYKDFAKSKGISNINSPMQLYEFPIIHKEQLKEDLEWFLDPRFKHHSFRVSTGGTTGSQTHLMMSNKAYSREWAFVNNYLRLRGIGENSKRLCLRGVSGIRDDKLIGYNDIYKELLISPFKLNTDSLSDNFIKISNFSAEWIHGYPSSVSQFADHLSILGHKLPDIKHILLVSEKLHNEQLASIKNTFDADILSFYGMTERVVFAPLINDMFTPSRLYGVTEEINGELVGTGFVNQATRLIRYRTGDEALVSKDNNGVVSEIISIEGRWGKEFLLGNKGEKITMTALNIHSDVLCNVNRYQFEQFEEGKCILKLVPNKILSKIEIESVRNEFQAKVGCALYIEAKVVSHIELTSRGKHLFINNHLVMS